MSTTDKRDRILTREVTVTQIPSGDKQTLFANETVFIHQVLGGSYTIQTSTGLFRLDGKDADAIGETVAVQTVTAATLADGAPDPEAVWDQLRKVYDPDGEFVGIIKSIQFKPTATGIGLAKVEFVKQP